MFLVLDVIGRLFDNIAADLTDFDLV